MRRFFITLTLTLALAAGTMFTTAGAAQAQRVKSVDQFSSRVKGGSIKSPGLHVIVSITGRYKFVRKFHGHRHTWYGIRVSAQHCKKSGCWGRIVKGKLPVRYPRGKAVHTKATAALGVSWPDWAKPTKWATGFKKTSNAIGHADEWFFKNVTLPCVAGTSAGWMDTARVQISRRIVFLGGAMSKAKWVAGAAGPEGYAVAAVGWCGAALGTVGVIKARDFARGLRNG